MARRLYKYIGPDYLGRVLSPPNHVVLRCSYPKDFDDPYELFLTIDFTAEPELLAFYEEVVGSLPQVPVICFSRAPDVIPMWAHYARGLRGAVVELDEAGLVKAVPGSGLGNVDYRDSPHDGLVGMLRWAYVTGKFRHLYLLQAGVGSAAYYTKADCWGYELERRMVLEDGSTRQEGPLMLLDAPASCVTALLAGPHSSDECRRMLQTNAEHLGCKYFEMRLGRSSIRPYFVDSQGIRYEFDGSQIAPVGNECASCGEPIPDAQDLCSWCQIGKAQRDDASERDSFRVLERFGLLDPYLRTMESIRPGDEREDGESPE